ELWTPEDYQAKEEGIMSQMTDKAREQAGNARDQIEKGAEKIYQQGSDAAHQAYEKTSEAWQYASDHAGRAAGAFRDFVKEQDMNHIVDEMSGVIRRHPLPAVLIGVGLGFLLSKLTRNQ